MLIRNGVPKARRMQLTRLAKLDTNHTDETECRLSSHRTPHSTSTKVVNKNSSGTSSVWVCKSKTSWRGKKILGQIVNETYPTAAEAMFIRRESRSDSPLPPQSIAFITTASLKTISKNSVSQMTEVLFELRGICKKILSARIRGSTVCIHWSQEETVSIRPVVRCTLYPSTKVTEFHSDCCKRSPNLTNRQRELS